MADMTKTLTALVINRLSRQKYHDLKTKGELKDDELYIITDDTLDAVGSTIANVAAPTLSSDAATKGYVDDNTVSAFVFKGKTYYRSSIELSEIYDLVFKIAQVLGATIKETESD